MITPTQVRGEGAKEGRGIDMSRGEGERRKRGTDERAVKSREGVMKEGGGEGQRKPSLNDSARDKRKQTDINARWMYEVRMMIHQNVGIIPLSSPRFHGICQ